MAAPGYVITNQHVLPHSAGKARDAIAVFHEGAKPGLAASVLWSSEELDLAILRVDGLDVPATTFSNAAIGSGAEVFAIGFPGVADAIDRGGHSVLVPTRTSGQVGRLIEADWRKSGRPISIVQHSAAISVGSSGGPLVNRCGQVVGVNVLFAMSSGSQPHRPGTGPPSTTAGQPISYAINAQEVVDALHRLQLQPVVTAMPCLLPGWSPAWMLIALGSSIASGLAVFLYMLRRHARRTSDTAPTMPHRPANLVVMGSEALRRRLVDRIWIVLGARRRKETEMEMYALVPIIGGRAGAPRAVSAEWARSHGGVIVGRIDGPARFRIDVTTVSREHARLSSRRHDRGMLTVEDLRSTNGTYLNDRRLVPGKPETIAPGDTVRFGGAEYRLELARRPRLDDLAAISSASHILAGRHPDTGKQILIPLDFGEAAGRRSVLIGRNRDACDVAITHPTVSRNGHARIFRDDNQLILSDVGSQNGVVVDGRLLKRGGISPLRDDSVIELGAITLAVTRKR